MSRPHPNFSNVLIEGNLFSRDFLPRLVAPLSDLPHTSPDSYGLGIIKIREAIALSWNNLAGRFARFNSEFWRLASAESGATLTRKEWLLPLLQELGFGRVQAASPLELGEKPYPISHGWNNTPIHLLGARTPLDKRSAGVQGAATQAPHALLQEALNRSDDHLWGIVSNGLKLRILRDSASIARLSYIEFDLEAMFIGEDLASFGALWLFCHASRFENKGKILEEWATLSREDGTRALDRLRDGTQQAIETLGTGFLKHPFNTALRQDLREDRISRMDFYRGALRVVYRVLFLLVAESKNALLLPNASDSEKALYEKFFSVSRLKDKSARRRGDEHHDLWRGLKVTFKAMQNGEASLAMPALGGFLFEGGLFDGYELSNRDLLAAFRALGFFEDNKGNRQAVNFNLGSEELGSVYESLLELSPILDLEARTFSFLNLAGNERKTTGAYYTPEILVKSLMQTALEPLIERAKQDADPENFLLSLSILDPACGSGHFLTAAARRVAHELALFRANGDEPSTAQKREAMRDVVSKCIYGIDLNPMAVELCKVALWMEALEPGKPLSFLDHHIRCGNALLGTRPEMLEELPDEAFKPLEGDDKTVVAGLKKQNKLERQGNLSLFDDGYRDLGDLRRALELIEGAPQDDVTQVRQIEGEFMAWQSAAPYRETHLLADSWCAAFVWKRVKNTEPDYVPPLTHSTIRAIGRDGQAPFPEQEAEIERLRNLYNWFHPHIEFPRVWEKGGFDLVIGNPPWERVKLQEKEWFATRAPEVANAPNAAARKRLIDDLLEDSPALHRDFLDARRRAEGESHFARSSGRYPLCGVGDVNTYALFAELNRDSINANGRVGCIVPSGIATDDTTKQFFADISQNQQLASLFDIENRQKIFPDVDSRFKFCLLTLTGKGSPVKAAQFVFFAHGDADLSDESKRFSLSPAEIALLNPNTKTCPIFRTTRDAELTKAIYERVPVLVAEGKGEAGNAWGISFLRMLDMSNDSGLFRSAEAMHSSSEYEEGLSTFSPVGDEWDINQVEFSYDWSLRRQIQSYFPLYEAKMLHQFDHRWATYELESTTARDFTLEEKQQPYLPVRPRYWVAGDEVLKRLTQKLPPSLFDLWLTRNEKGVRKILEDWFIGWLFNHDKADKANYLSGKTTSPLSWESTSDLVEQYFERRITVEAFEKQFPLSEIEHYLIAKEWDNPLEAAARLIEKRIPQWLLGFRDITNSTNERTVISSILPRSAVGHTMPLIFTGYNAKQMACLQSNLSAFVFDYVARQKIGGTHLTYGLFNQLPVLPPSIYELTPPWTNGETLQNWISSRVVELCYTAHDLAPFAHDCGYNGPPFAWNEERRCELRCELDAAFFALYDISPNDADYMMDTFSIVKRKDEAKWGSYRTKERVLKLLMSMNKVSWHLQKGQEEEATQRGSQTFGLIDDELLLN